MRILIAMTRAFDPYAAGVQRSTFKLGEYFFRCGFNVAYFSTKSDGHKHVEFKDHIFMATGFKFKGSQQKKYNIKVKTGGTFEKLVVMRISEKIEVPKKAVKDDGLSKV